MNNSSSWNCFSWNRARKGQTDDDQKSPKKHQERVLAGGGDGGEISDEQFANLLGGEYRRVTSFSLSLFCLLKPKQNCPLE